MVLGRPKIVDFWGLAAPAAPKTISEGGGLRPSPFTFGMVAVAAGAARTPTIDDSRPAPNPCTKNSSVIPSTARCGPQRFNTTFLKGTEGAAN